MIQTIHSATKQWKIFYGRTLFQWAWKDEYLSRDLWKSWPCHFEYTGQQKVTLLWEAGVVCRLFSQGNFNYGL